MRQWTNISGETLIGENIAEKMKQFSAYISFSPLVNRIQSTTEYNQTSQPRNQPKDSPGSGEENINQNQHEVFIAHTSFGEYFFTSIYDLAQYTELPVKDEASETTVRN